nr:MAG TPA: hypothetical protein [Caudoviricetes sp.]
MRRRVLHVRTDREAAVIRRGADRVAELRRVDQCLPSLARRPYGGLPAFPFGAAALLEPLERGLSDAFGEGRVYAPLVYLRIRPELLEEPPRISFYSDAIQGLHPPHAPPAENPGV